MKRLPLIFAIFAVIFVIFGSSAEAAAPATSPGFSLDLGDGGTLTERVLQLTALLTILSLAPSIVIMTTSFVRIVVVLSLLRTAVGLQQSPPNVVPTITPSLSSAMSITD